MNDDIDKTNPGQDDWIELLAALHAAAIDGTLKSLTFALVDKRMPDQAMVDSYGPPDITEMACRISVDRIASTVAITNMSLAQAIREGLPKARARH